MDGLIAQKFCFNKYKKNVCNDKFRIVEIKPFYVMNDNGKIINFSTMPDIADYLKTNIPNIQRHLAGSKVKTFVSKGVTLEKTKKPYIVEIDGVTEEYGNITEISKKLNISVSNFHNKLKEYIYSNK